MNEEEPLSSIEETLGNLGIALSQAPYTHPSFILSPPVEAHGATYSNDAIRLTYHYTSALLSYGFLPSHAELKHAGDWFATPFSSDTQTNITEAEMYRLETLLNLRPGDAYVRPRLQRLTYQKMVPSNYFRIYGGSEDHLFNTLWAIRVLALAAEKNVLGDLFNADSIINTIDGFSFVLDKDIALALNLRYRITGQLLPRQEALLEQLVTTASGNGGYWGSSQQAIGLMRNLQDHDLLISEIATQRDELREVIINTCYVIENLMVMVTSYPQLRESIDTAITLWWNIFAGPNASNVLNELFPAPYDYLQVLFRTLITVRAYLGTPLREWCWAQTHRELTQQHKHDFASIEIDSIQNALRQWLHIGLDSPPEALNLGLSESSVVRVKPRIGIPELQTGVQSRFPLVEDTLIVKYGPEDEIRLEQQNYASLPSRIQECCVRIPEISYVEPTKRRAYVIMQDLFNYETLYELLQRGSVSDSLYGELASFLVGFHLGEKQTKPKRGRLTRFYLIPMQEQIETIFDYMNHIRQIDKLPRELEPEIELILNNLHSLMADLVRHQYALEDFPGTPMHGDLNTRNIMIRRLQRGDKKFAFKLIDIEKYEREGDAAFDLGELLADLKLVRQSKNWLRDHKPITEMTKTLHTEYQRIAQNRQDKRFFIRVELAQSRMLIRVSKGRTKYGQVQLAQGQLQNASNIAYEILAYAKEAEKKLRNVLMDLGKQVE